MEIKFTDKELLHITVGAVQTLVQEKFAEAVAKRLEEIREELKDFDGNINDLQEKYAPKERVAKPAGNSILVPNNVLPIGPKKH